MDVDLSASAMVLAYEYKRKTNSKVASAENVIAQRRLSVKLLDIERSKYVLLKQLAKRRYETVNSLNQLRDSKRNADYLTDAMHGSDLRKYRDSTAWRVRGTDHAETHLKCINPFLVEESDDDRIEDDERDNNLEKSFQYYSVTFRDNGIPNNLTLFARGKQTLEKKKPRRKALNFVDLVDTVKSKQKRMRQSYWKRSIVAGALFEF